MCNIAIYRKEISNNNNNLTSIFLKNFIHNSELYADVIHFAVDPDLRKL